MISNSGFMHPEYLVDAEWVDVHKDDPNDRFYGTLAAELISVMYGADILRTHNVGATKDILKISEKLLQNTKKGL